MNFDTCMITVTRHDNLLTLNLGCSYEFATTVRHYYGRTPYIAFQIFYNLSMQASNIAAMIISSKVQPCVLAPARTVVTGVDNRCWTSLSPRLATTATH